MIHSDCNDPVFLSICEKCKPYTMTPIERMAALYNAVHYIIDQQILGDFVECGVWKGGSCMIIALALMQLQQTERKIYLYDTFLGMSKPSERDISHQGHSALERWKLELDGPICQWCYSPLEEVYQNMISTGYPIENLIFVKGKVEETIPKTIPETIAILRLDTDWYTSTYHELSYLYPKLAPGGVLIIDDYAHWRGAKEATDAYFRDLGLIMELKPIDQWARITIKKN